MTFQNKGHQPAVPTSQLGRFEFQHFDNAAAAPNFRRDRLDSRQAGAGEPVPAMLTRRRPSPACCTDSCAVLDAVFMESLHFQRLDR
jgi:hypothetical protein